MRIVGKRESGSEKALTDCHCGYVCWNVCLKSGLNFTQPQVMDARQESEKKEMRKELTNVEKAKRAGSHRE